MKKAAFIYDREADSLIVFREDRRTHANLRLDEIIIGFDKNLQVSSVEILNPDKLYNIPKYKLSQLSSAHIRSSCRGSMLWIYLILELKNKEIEEIPVSVPLRHPVPC